VSFLLLTSFAALALTLSSSSTGNLATRSFGHQYHLDNTTDPLEFTPILEEEEADSDLGRRAVGLRLPRVIVTNSTTNTTAPTNTTIPSTNTTAPSPRQRIEMLSWPPAPAGGFAERFEWQSAR